MNQSLKGYVMILLSAFGFGSYGIWARFIGQDFGIFFQGWVRSAMVLLCLIPIAIFTRRYKKVERLDRKWILIAVSFGVFTQAPLYYALNNMDIGTATLIFYSTYLISSYIIGKISFKERMGVAKFVSLTLAVVGLLLIFGFSQSLFSLSALLLAAINGIASGGEVAYTKKSTNKFSSLQVAIYIWFGILITHLPISILVGEPQVAFALNSVWLSMIAFAVIGLVSFWLVVEGYRFVDASIGGLIGLLEIVFGVVFGILVFNEKLTMPTIVGGTLIILATMIPNIVDLRTRQLNKLVR